MRVERGDTARRRCRLRRRPDAPRPARQLDAPAFFLLSLSSPLLLEQIARDVEVPRGAGFVPARVLELREQRHAPAVFWFEVERALEVVSRLRDSPGGELHLGYAPQARHVGGLGVQAFAVQLASGRGVACGAELSLRPRAPHRRRPRRDVRRALEQRARHGEAGEKVKVDRVVRGAFVFARVLFLAENLASLLGFHHRPALKHLVVFRVGARGGDVRLAGAVDVPERIREQTRERDARVRFARLRLENLAIQMFGSVALASQLLQPGERVLRLDVPRVARDGARKVPARRLGVAGAAHRLRPRGQNHGLRATQRGRRRLLRRRLNRGKRRNGRRRRVVVRAGLLLRDDGGSLGFVQHAERALEEPIGGVSVPGAKLHHRPLAQRFGARARTSLGVQERRAIQSARAFRVPLHEFEPRPLLPQARLVGGLARALVKQLARRLGAARAGQVPHELPLHDSAGLFAQRATGVARGVLSPSHARGRGRRRERRRRHGGGGGERGERVLDRRRVFFVVVVVARGARNDELAVDVESVQTGRRRRLVFVARACFVFVVVVVVARVSAKRRLKVVSVRRVAEDSVVARSVSLRERVRKRLSVERERVFFRRDGPLDGGGGGSVGAGQRPDGAQRRREPRKLLRAHRPVLVRVQHLQQFVRGVALVVRGRERGHVVRLVSRIAGRERSLGRAPHLADHRAQLFPRDATVAVQVEHPEHAIRRVRRVRRVVSQIDE